MLENDFNYFVQGGASSLPSSPRRFANHGLVYLSEIETVTDLQELSTKQIKDLLAMNRVNFKGCVEKDELLKILQRLWEQEQRNKSNVDNMDDESLCKICMDSPVTFKIFLSNCVLKYFL